MYVQGVSTRKVAAITERLCGSEISSTQVSRAAALLDEVLEAWRNRPLDTIIYLYLLAMIENVLVDGQIRDAAVLIASGVKPDGKRSILGVSVSMGEKEAALARLPAWLERERPERCGTDHQRCPRGSAGNPKSGLQRHSLAEVSVSFTAECQPVCASPEHEERSSCRHTGYLQCFRSNTVCSSSAEDG